MGEDIDVIAGHSRLSGEKIMIERSFGHGRTINPPWPNDHSTVAE